MYKLINDDAILTMNQLEDNSIDMVFCDLPYGTTQNKWDSQIPLDELWKCYNRIVKRNGAVVLTASQPFTSQLILSNIENFRYEWIWKKTVGSGQLNIKHQPLKIHESVIIFYKEKPQYNEQLREGKPYKIARKGKEFKQTNYGKQKDTLKENTGFRHAQSVIEIKNPRIKNGHPTQKPIELCEYFIKTYSNESDTILDNCMGSGTTGIACINTKRNFIGIEKEINYFNSAKQRIENHESSISNNI
jgi:site-specific DNA-methyltransferase (adenine-specific)